MMQTNLMVSPSLSTEAAPAAASLEAATRPLLGLPAGQAGLFAALLESLARELRLSLSDTSPAIALRASGPADETRGDAKPEGEESLRAAEHEVLPAAYQLAYALSPLAAAPPARQPAPAAELPEMGAPPSEGPSRARITAVERGTPPGDQPAWRLAQSDARGEYPGHAALNPTGGAPAIPASWVETISSGRPARSPEGQAPSWPQPLSPEQREQEMRPTQGGLTSGASVEPPAPSGQDRESVRLVASPPEGRLMARVETLPDPKGPGTRAVAGASTPEVLPALERRGIRKVAGAAMPERTALPQLPTTEAEAVARGLLRGVGTPDHEGLGRQAARPEPHARPAAAPPLRQKQEDSQPRVAAHTGRPPGLAEVAAAEPAGTASPRGQPPGTESTLPDLSPADPRGLPAAKAEGLPPVGPVAVTFPSLGEARSWAPEAATAAEPGQPMPGRVAPQQLPAAITSLVVSGDGEARIRLDPPSLGSVEVTVQHQDGRVSVSLEVASPEARDAIQAALPALRSALERQGFQVEGFSLTHDPSWAMGSFLGDRRQDWGHPPPGGLRLAPYAPAEQGRPEGAAALLEAAPPRGGARVDYRV